MGPEHAAGAPRNAQKTTMNDADIALLRAALCDGDTAIQAFETWRSLANPEREHNEAHYRILPLLHENLRRLGVDHPLMPHLKKIRYRAWCQAQTRIRDAEMAIGALNDARIPTMVTKGMALVDGYYGHAALRPMADVDIIVKHEDVDRAVATLRAAGWHNPAEMFQDAVSGRAYLDSGNALNFVRDGATDIDFHWQPFHECMSQQLRDAFWADAEEILIGKTRCLRPSADSLLFHIITHGMRPNVFNPMRWIADAAIVLQNAGDRIDWDALYRYARKARLFQRLRLGLAEMEHVMGQPVAPAPPVLRPSLIEAMEQRAFRAIRADMDFDTAIDKMRWPRRFRIMVSDTGRNGAVWRTFLSRQRPNGS